MQIDTAGFQDTHRTEFVSRLERLLKKSEERREKFHEKAKKYESIVSRDKQEGKVGVVRVPFPLP